MDEMNSLEFKYLLLSQRSNYEQLKKLTTDENIIAQIDIFIKIIDDTLSK